MTLLRMSIFNHACPSLNFGYPLFRITTMDSHNRIMVIQNSVMDIRNYRIYSCLTFRIQRTSRCPEFTAVLSIPYLFFIIPALNEVEWVYTGFKLFVCPSVRLWTESCPLCIFHSTNRTHFIFTHLINKLQKVCRALSFVKNSKILAISLNCTFHSVLCPCNVKS